MKITITGQIKGGKNNMIKASLEKLCFPLHQEAIAYVIRAEDGQPEGHIVGPHAALWLPFDHSKFLSP